jgi:hypothetical protein
MKCHIGGSHFEVLVLKVNYCIHNWSGIGGISHPYLPTKAKCHKLLNVVSQELGVLSGNGSLWGVGD